MCLYFDKVTSDGIETNRSFRDPIKAFMKNKSCRLQSDIMLTENNKIITEEKDLITEEKDLAETFNNHYINIVKKSRRIKPANFSMLNDNERDIDTAINIIKEAY